MLTIIYKQGIFVYSWNIQDYNSRTIKSGMVATFTNNREVGLCSNETVPIGFFLHDNVPANPYESFGFGDLKASVAVGGELQTDIFEPGEYRINDFLYCSPDGKITNSYLYRGNIIIGIVNAVEPDFAFPRLIGFLTCFTRGLETGEIAPVKRINRYQILKES
jgi:hypothetical protein